MKVLSHGSSSMQFSAPILRAVVWFKFSRFAFAQLGFEDFWEEECCSWGVLSCADLRVTVLVFQTWLVD